MSSMRKKKNPERRRPLIEEVEPRILYSADVAPIAAPPLPAEHRTLDTSGGFVSQASSAQQATGRRASPSRDRFRRHQHPGVPKARRRHPVAIGRAAQDRRGAARRQRRRHQADQQRARRAEGCECRAPDLARRRWRGAAGCLHAELRFTAEERRADQRLGPGVVGGWGPADLRLRRGGARRRQGTGGRAVAVDRGGCGRQRKPDRRQRARRFYLRHRGLGGAQCPNRAGSRSGVASHRRHQERAAQPRRSARRL